MLDNINTSEEREQITSPLKAIRAHCLGCCGSAQEVKLCTVKQCYLYPFRFGKNPYTSRKRRKLTDDERAELAQRLAEARKSSDK